MGGKGSGRPKGSYKPLSEVFRGIHDDIEDLERSFVKRTNALEDEFAEKTNALSNKVNYHFKIHLERERKQKQRS